MKQEIQKRIDQIKSRQVPDGYKRTSSGIFPCDWELDKSFSDLFTFHGNLGKSREELGDEGICYLHYGDMHRNSSYIVKYSDYLNEPKYDINLSGSEDFLMQDGDISFLDASEDLEGTSRAVLIDNPDNKPFIAGLHTILAKEKSKVFSKYFKQYITIPQEVYKQFQRLAVGFKVYGLNKDTLGWINVSYPMSIEEQEKIAQILMTWDKAIELQEKYLDGIELKKKAVIQRLIIPQKDWIRTPLDKVLRERKTYSEDNGSFIHVTLCKDGVVDKTERYERDFLVKDEEKRYKITCPKDICYNPANLKFGVICINKYGTAIFSPIYVTFEVCTNYDVDFVGAVLTSANFIRYIRKYEEGSIYERQAVKAEDFLLGYISVPRLSVQKEIAKTISKMEQVVSFQKQKLDKLKRQRKSLQQLLLTGIVRV